MNMVRTGVVRHPSEWEFNGYNKLLNPPRRYSLIDYDTLISLCEIQNIHLFQEKYKLLIEEEIKKDSHQRNAIWTESLAVGNKNFTENIKQKFGTLARGRRIKAVSETYTVSESQTPYNKIKTKEKKETPQNSFIWNFSV